MAIPGAETHRCRADAHRAAGGSQITGRHLVCWCAAARPIQVADALTAQQALIMIVQPVKIQFDEK